MSDQSFMDLALAEARKGTGRTSPNPCVGAVIVKDNRVIATGYHKKAGTPHAEVHALRKAGDKAVGATLYVTLEPCSHSGKTPPCSHAVVKSGIQRVVIGMLDPNPLVDGGGRQYLLDNGLEVTTGVLEAECRSINEAFLKFITSGRPLVIMKAGISLDGRLNYESGKSGWITGPESSEKVHQLRDRLDAILVGSKTIQIDNPSLTTRLKEGTGKDPIRIVLDSHLSILPSAQVLNLESDAPTWVFCCQGSLPDKIKKLEDKGIRIYVVKPDQQGHPDPAEVMRLLAGENITSVLIEGGGHVHTSFLQARLVDKVCLFYAPLFAGSDGVPLTPGLHISGRGNAIGLDNVRYSRVGEDIMVEGDIKYP